MKTIFGNICCIFLLVLLLPLNAYSEDWIYTVRQGDTLWDLCLKYTEKKDCWIKAGPYNSVKYPKTLAPGTRIAFPADWLKNAPAKAEIIYIKGHVEISEFAHSSQDTPRAAMKKGEVGDLLDINTRIKTLKGSSTTLRFADGSVLSLDENSELTLDVLSRYSDTGMVDTRLNLISGAAKTKVPKRTPPSKFSISTPSAIAAVRGTDFSVISVNGHTPYMLSEVYKGTVGVSSEGTPEILVNKGFGLKAEKGKEIRSPLPLLPAPEFQQFEAVQTLPINLQWQPVDGAQSYRIEILQNTDEDKLVRTKHTEETNLTVSDLKTGCYRIRLSSRDANELHGQYQEQNICAASPIGTAVLNSKIENENKELTLHWSNVEGAKNYLVEASYDEDFEQIVFSEKTIETTLIFSPTKKKRIYFRVKAVGEYDTENTPSNTASWKPKSSMWLTIGGIAMVMLVLIL